MLQIFGYPSHSNLWSFGITLVNEKVFTIAEIMLVGLKV